MFAGCFKDKLRNDSLLKQLRRLQSFIEILSKKRIYILPPPRTISDALITPNIPIKHNYKIYKMLLNSTMTKQNKNTNFLPVFIDDSLLRTRKIFLYIVTFTIQNKNRKKSKRLENLQKKLQRTEEIDKLEKIFAITLSFRNK